MAFPEGFGWGACIPSTGAWGLAPASDLADWLERTGSKRSRSPAGGAGSPGLGTGALVHELDLLAGLGLGHVRLTLDWAQIEPSNGHRDVETVERLRNVLPAARDLGLRVWGCLHDGPLPGWFAHDERGFGDVRSRRYHWARHVEFVAETFGDLVHGWVPVAEPSRWAMRGWLTGDRPPGQVDDSEAFAAALEAVHLASVEAALRLRGNGQPIATAQWLVPLFPARLQPGAPPTPDAEAMTSVADEVLWGCWQRMLVEETLVVPGRPPVEVPGAREAFDLIGFTYHHALAVRGDGTLLPYPQTLAAGPDGQVPWADGLGVVLHRLADAFADGPLFVGGVGLLTVEEEQRQRYLRDTLATVGEAVDDGVDLRGFWWDTPLDGATGSDFSATGASRGLFAPDGTARPAAELWSAVIDGADVPA